MISKISYLINKSDKSIHELTFTKIPSNWKNNKLNDKWLSLYKIKQEVNIAIEEKTTRTPNHCINVIFSFKNIHANTIVIRPNIDAATEAKTENSSVPAYITTAKATASSRPITIKIGSSLIFGSKFVR